MAQRDRQMLPVPDRVKFTYDDLLALPDDGMRHEIIDGEHNVTPSPGSAHQHIVGNIYFLLREHLGRHPGGVVMLAPFDVVLSQFDVVEPDVIYFAKDRFREVVTERNAKGAPNLAVEVLSASTRRRDEIVKRRLHEFFGIEEYWVVDPELEAIKVYRMVGGKYKRVAELTLEAEGVLTSPQLPGLELSLASVFALP